jgi:hypothetical protein
MRRRSRSAASILTSKVPSILSILFLVSARLGDSPAAAPASLAVRVPSQFGRTTEI